MKIYVTRPDIPVKAIESLKKNHEVNIYDKHSPISREALLAGVKGVDALYCLLTDKIDKEVLDAAGPQLKVIATMSVGYDHIDIAECKARGIKVSNTPNVSTDSVAELTVTLLLAAGRRLLEASSAIKNGEWIYHWSPMWLCGYGLHGATVGIVGMGRIGELSHKSLNSQVADGPTTDKLCCAGQGVMQRVLPFGVSKVLYYDVFHPIKPAEEMGAIYTPFEELVKQADFIVAMCNLSAETHHLFNKKAFDLMKPNAVFVNTSRGGVVNQDDLHDALKAKKIHAAGLDVMDPEPLPRDNKLTTLDNISELTTCDRLLALHITCRRCFSATCDFALLTTSVWLYSPNSSPPLCDCTVLTPHYLCVTVQS
ncbi:GRHPR [Cordylochernes scorpioides]|uniref:GRHPR n=1 Tax=Cordylochernes scorpioides TaxID=51811 RepID=A0ABY6KER8_9ARAC|nr:GRHPR [Cordylochernes scorpioides]